MEVYFRVSTELFGNF